MGLTSSITLPTTKKKIDIEKEKEKILKDTKQKFMHKTIAFSLEYPKEMTKFIINIRVSSFNTEKPIKLTIPFTYIKSKMSELLTKEQLTSPKGSSFIYKCLDIEKIDYMMLKNDLKLKRNNDKILKSNTLYKLYCVYHDLFVKELRYEKEDTDIYQSLVNENIVQINKIILNDFIEWIKKRDVKLCDFTKITSDLDTGILITYI